MVDPVTNLLALVPAQYLVYIAAALYLAAIADAWLPLPNANSPWVRPRQILHLLAQNYGRARNAVPAGSVPAPVAAKAEETREIAAQIEAAAGELAQAAKGQAEAAKPGASADLAAGTLARNSAILFGLGLACMAAACTPAQLATTQVVLSDAKALCLVGQGMVALQGKAQADVAEACALAGGVVVPQDGSATVTVPLGAVGAGASR